MAGRWEDTEQLLLGCAEDDLREDGVVAPALAAFAGANLRFIAWLRPFAPGEYANPLIELFALAAPLDADRLMLSISARAWSPDDPIPPVTRGADLRQRILMLHVVDGADGDPRSHSILWPFELAVGEPAWGQRRQLEAGQGWIPEAMAATVRSRHQLRAPLGEVARQAARVVHLGHDLHLAEDVALLLSSQAAGR